mgnify:CR=1 FL=1
MNDMELYQKLPYFLRNYVDSKRWQSFRSIQRQAFEIIQENCSHLIISSGTSSGKTEAAFLPVLSKIYRDNPKRISVLYVSPLIALIDDQNNRLSCMIKDSDINLFSWHGDISSSVKRRVMKDGRGILQITPESLQNIVNKSYDVLQNMFSDLRFIIIDEVHSFMNSDRGLQLLCEFGRIEQISGCKPIRIGLSATLSDYNLAKEWLRSNTNMPVELIDSSNDSNYDLVVRYSRLAEKDTPERQESLKEYYQSIYDDSFGYNCIVFANNRTTVENIAVGLKLISKIHNSHIDVHAHHSSVSKEYRNMAEEHLKNPEKKCIAIATSTLELGIEIGDLERVILINAPQSVSSLVQKMGRSGRTTKCPVVRCHCNNMYPSKLIGIDTDLIKTIAECLLYFEEKWIEPVKYSGRPYSLLFQQTLSYVCSRIAVTKSELYSDILSLYPFKNIERADFYAL